MIILPFILHNLYHIYFKIGTFFETFSTCNYTVVEKLLWTFYFIDNVRAIYEDF